MEVPPVLVSIVVSIPACHAGDRGSIPRRGVTRFGSKASPTKILCDVVALKKRQNRKNNHFKEVKHGQKTLCG